jgi:hypothetical protein
MEGRSVKLSKLRQEKKHLKNFNSHKNEAIQLHNEYEELLKQIFLVKSYLSELDIKEF